mmetsp:Transcript_136272/g.240862  ORF Transcript_136272/g.240862 Transcript_136272/m.240862 type:complete len:204 (-) Transcript_136272:148-759(-)
MGRKKSGNAEPEPQGFKGKGPPGYPGFPGKGFPMFKGKGKGASSAADDDDWWCWYCGHRAESERLLIQHQRLRHFQCHNCSNQKLCDHIFALKSHVRKLHQVFLNKVPNAIEGRDNVEIEVLGKRGIPEITDMDKAMVAAIGAQQAATRQTYDTNRPDWEEVMHNGRKYYYNKMTQEVTWILPKEPDSDSSSEDERARKRRRY